ncbi:PH domain-containing protein [Bacillus taeanensis]|uniref:YdbS-like PH domain-containing protein n=1 Tax=Bacillus taeanensis TaxID=273032 RepID=A0A366XQP9_9BACI|nr:PH domain-containing protein [Bacillus taeanensis]RBW67838.1 hypothetical protein DS031_20040 [Bacillus taeanensis]
MRNRPKHSLDPKALTVWRIHGILNTIVVWVLPFAYFILRKFDFIPHLSNWIPVLLMIIPLVYTLFAVVIMPSLQMKRWRYEVTEHEIDLERGVLFVKKTLIPMVRVQHVDTKQGPVYRRYQLASVTISTAATVHEIPALSNSTAEELRDRISELARVADDDVS